MTLRLLLLALCAFACATPLPPVDNCQNNTQICGATPEIGQCVAIKGINGTRYDCICGRNYWHREATGGCVLKPSITSNISSFAMLCLMLVVGKILRFWLKPLQLLYLPSSVIGGTLALIIVQLCKLNPEFYDYVDREWIAGWHNHPGFLINVVFSALFLGVDIPPVKKVWSNSSNQLCYGMFVAWSQWFTALGFGALLSKFFPVDIMFGVSIPVGFSGGHGTAAGLQVAFENANWKSGSSVCLGTATIGLLSSVIVGMVLVNVAARKKWVKYAKMSGGTTILSLRGVNELHERPSAGQQTVSADSIDVFALHLAIIGVAMLIGYGTKTGLVALENLSEKMSELGIFRGFPLFPFCMVGGAIIQKILQRFNRRTRLVDANVMDRVSGSALDFLIVAAMGTVDLSTISASIVPFLLLIAFALTWQFICLFVISRVMFKSYFFENSICVFGQATGVIASGLILLRMVDPESRTGVAGAFGYKQLLHSPFMGGGIWTALAVPLFRIVSIWGMLGISGAMSLIFFGLGFAIRNKTRVSEDETLGGILGKDDMDDDSRALLTPMTGMINDEDSPFFQQ